MSKGKAVMDRGSSNSHPIPPTRATRSTSLLQYTERFRTPCCVNKPQANLSCVEQLFIINIFFLRMVRPDAGLLRCLDLKCSISAHVPPWR